jgi:hypothetical protein
MATENQQPITADATGQPQGEQNGGTGEQQQAISFATKDELQAHIESVLKERLERERVKSERAAQKAKEEAEAAAATRNGEWQTLSEQRATKIAELEQQLASLDDTTTKAQRYEQALRSQVETLRKDVPKHLIPLLDKLDPVEQLAWLSENRAELAPKSTGVPATPRAQGSTDAAAQEQARQQAASFYRDL